MRVQGQACGDQENPRGRTKTNCGPEEYHGAVWAMVIRCGRCCGLLCRIQLRDWGGSRGQDGCDALQCIACGDIIDPVIVKNRRRSSRPSTAHPKTREGRPRVAIVL